MAEHVVLLSVPGLRAEDVTRMPRLSARFERGVTAPLTPHFPAVTCAVQANMTTGKTASEHGVVANGFYWPQSHEVEMWTAWNEAVLAPQLWDLLHRHDPSLKCAAWFPLLVKGAGADFICTPAPIHNPDGSESLWCYTKPEGMYGELRDALGHFPLQHFWGPLAGIQSTAWIVDSAVRCAELERPNLFYIYLPHLDYASQKFGPDSWEAHRACSELDGQLGKLFDGFDGAYPDTKPLWLVASEYVVSPVDHVTYPNRVLRDAGLLAVCHDADGRELIDRTKSRAWVLCDHQHGHVFLRDHAAIGDVLALFENRTGIAAAWTRDNLRAQGLNHVRAGDVVLVSTPNSWQAYYWWNDDALAPKFARNVDIHRKPGFDPVEMFLDPESRSIPLDATLVKGSHGAPAVSEAQRGVLLASDPTVLTKSGYRDTDIAAVVLGRFGL